MATEIPDVSRTLLQAKLIRTKLIKRFGIRDEACLAWCCFQYLKLQDTLLSVEVKRPQQRQCTHTKGTSGLALRDGRHTLPGERRL